MMNSTPQPHTGLWKNNPAMIQLLGLCPLLATSTSVVNALVMGIMTIFVLVITALIVASVKQWIDHVVRLPIFMLIIASTVTLSELLLQVIAYDLYIELGIFIPLIVTNCLIIGRAEMVFSKVSWRHACLDALMMGIGFTWVLLVLGAVREILVKGTLFSGFNNILGGWLSNWIGDLTVYITSPQLLVLAGMPAGAFILFGLLLAIQQKINARINASLRAKPRIKSHTKNNPQPTKATHR
ncbi:electron transport complex subunit E [Ostreibacterium oceani]|uniref:Electron transport complex subunit RsxE n=1 Tax=Ostreibacterium oceani TaxID=2654998 RepID=A0A6N7ETE9_9GAMM|nr:electron transport complex subunit E [Ostreibacterium oceani]MPV85831.1 electron transport complex subunit RsxE [Ostreibacterium oceani]